MENSENFNFLIIKQKILKFTKKKKKKKKKNVGRVGTCFRLILVYIMGEQQTVAENLSGWLDALSVMVKRAQQQFTL